MRGNATIIQLLICSQSHFVVQDSACKLPGNVLSDYLNKEKGSFGDDSPCTLRSRSLVDSQLFHPGAHFGTTQMQLLAGHGG
jgi:hypothetical protein